MCYRRYRTFAQILCAFGWYLRNERFFTVQHLPDQLCGQLAFCPMGTSVISVGWPTREANHSPPSSDEVNEWSYTTTPPSVYVAWCSDTRNNSTVTLRTHCLRRIYFFIILDWDRRGKLISESWRRRRRRRRKGISYVLIWCVVFSFTLGHDLTHCAILLRWHLQFALDIRNETILCGEMLLGSAPSEAVASCSDLDVRDGPMLTRHAPVFLVRVNVNDMTFIFDFM
jgi:hypothetical protein